MRKLRRVGMFAVALAGLLGTSVQPAAAAEVTEVVFAGTATVGGGGIAFPCFPGIIDTFGNVSDCPLVPGGTDISTQNLPTGHNPLTYTRPVFHGGDSASMSFTSTACLATDATVGKTDDHTLGAGTCLMVANGLVHGYCGLAEGFLTGAWAVTSSSLVPPTGPGSTRVYNFSIRFTTVGAVSAFRGSVGNTTTGQSGELTGTFVAVPTDPVGCFDNDPKDFVVTGAATAVLN